jgi:photosynthetic reaction center cytochrome c subunit
MFVKKVLGAGMAGALLFGNAATLWTQSSQPATGNAVIGKSATGKSATGTAGPRTAEQVYKNIQVMKEVPADELFPAMQFITASLGVECDFCHLENAFEKDDKETKQTARKMMRMMSAINKENFDGHREVTCYSCHRGAHKPVNVPIISEEEGKFVGEEKTQHNATNAPNQPSADQILGKYLQAVGGPEAAARISTRIQKGTITVSSKKFPVEVLTKEPAKRITTIRYPGGDSVTGTNGEEGWLMTPGRPVHAMSLPEVDAARMDAELFFPASLGRILKELRVEPSGQIDGRAVDVLTATPENLPPVQLYFDEQSGLLVRVLRYAETPLGLNPTQIDYADYREEGGVKTPFRWTIARPSGSFTIQIEQMQQNVPIEDDKFAKPAASP